MNITYPWQIFKIYSSPKIYWHFSKLQVSFFSFLFIIVKTFFWQIKMENFYLICLKTTNLNNFIKMQLYECYMFHTVQNTLVHKKPCGTLWFILGLLAHSNKIYHYHKIHLHIFKLTKEPIRIKEMEEANSNVWTLFIKSTNRERRMIKMAD